MSVGKLILAALGSAMLLAPGAAFAAPDMASGPEPYTAPDPVYPATPVKSDVTIVQPKDHVSLTSDGAPASAATPN